MGVVKIGMVRTVVVDAEGDYFVGQSFPILFFIGWGEFSLHFTLLFMLHPQSVIGISSLISIFSQSL